MGLLNRLKKGEPAPAVRRNPAEEQFQQALDLSNQEKHQEAISAFRRVLELDPNFQPDTVHYGIALAYDAQGMDDFAIEELRRVLAYNPSHVEAHVIMGSIHARRNRFDQAVLEYETALRMRPGHELAGEMRRSIQQWKADASGETLARMRQDLSVFIRQAEGQFRVRLDFTPASLAVMDGLIDAGWTPQAGGMGVLKLAGTYVGEVICRNLGGEWRIAQPPEESEISGLGRRGVKPFYFALDKFKKGRAGSLHETYRALSADIEALRKSVYR